MKQLVVGTDNIKEAFPENKSIEPFEMNGFKMMVGLVEVDDITFDTEAEENLHKVLVNIKAFSCNYRDKSIMMGYRFKMNEEPDKAKLLFKAVGSDFMGVVVKTGAMVTQLVPGDRVISDSTYPFFEPGTATGIPSNSASKEYDIFHWSKLMKIPAEINDEVGAAFTIGGITAYSMVRKLNLQDNDMVLVTSAKSNTSLFVLNALKKYKNVSVYAISSNDSHHEKIKALGVKDLVIIDPKQMKFSENHQLAEIMVRNNKPFNKVIDPFFDLHLGKVISVMEHFGKYVSCGKYNQYDVFLEPDQRIDYHYLNVNIYNIFNEALGRNIEMSINCLGIREDLKQAVDDFAKGDYDVLIDSVYSGDDVRPFLERTYNNSSDRIGKVVYKF
jgi:NADPH:quinone reductase-like Zn-dependent oxidoreductase